MVYGRILCSVSVALVFKLFSFEKSGEGERNKGKKNELLREWTSSRVILNWFKT
jgi:hypothetical protein